MNTKRHVVNIVATAGPRRSPQALVFVEVLSLTHRRG